MTHELASFGSFASAIIAVLSGSITIALYKRRKRTGILALNWLVILFISLCLLGLAEFSTYLFHSFIPFFNVNDGTTPLYLNFVRVINLASIFSQRVLCLSGIIRLDLLF